MSGRGSALEIARFLEAYDRVNKVFASVTTFPQGVQLSKADLQVLKVIARQDGITMTRLAQELGVRLSTATGVVNRLVERGLVKRIRNHGDRRLVRLSTTPQAGRILSAHRKQMRSAIGRMMNMLSPAERQSLISIMEKVGSIVAAEAAQSRS